jgi:hypothetical protein
MEGRFLPPAGFPGLFIVNPRPPRKTGQESKISAPRCRRNASI